MNVVSSNVYGTRRLFRVVVASHRSLESEDEIRERLKRGGRKEGRKEGMPRKKEGGDVSRVAIVIQIGWKLFSERHLDPARSSKMAPHEYIIVAIARVAAG